ncbi:hypothetical protein CCMSSC00406_0007762 [Pleurotus cornucopiae]|uniref:Uncharacterized protein n=1 Tax=Pleurotus cornucopiae TaxID=5321 RepID=A0ACB7J5I7_PLECO|nr:hypothetical protein CCMSSC00406_0007762 [Pleurotus cornucopiae]
MSPPKSQPPAEPKSILYRAHAFLAICGIIYGLLMVLLFVPFIQTHVLYMNAIRIPWFAKYDVPEQYGFAPGKAVNLRLQTADNVSIGAWFVLADSYYQTIYPSSPESYTSPTREELLFDHVPHAVASRPTIVFFHGNMATRVFFLRVAYYKAFASRLGANVLAIDYRGFGDSDGTPSEDGLAKDARAAWDWVIETKKHAAADRVQDLGDDVLIVGHSLGTAVAARLAAELSQENVKYRGVVLLSPFESIGNLLAEYHFFGVIPLMKPIHSIPGAGKILNWGLVHKFDTAARLHDIKEPILIAHAENDWDIPSSHSENLFNAILDPHLPAVPEVPLGPISWTKEDWAAFTQEKAFRAKAREALVTTYSIPDVGLIERFEKGGNKAVFFKTLHGGHDMIALQEGVQEEMRRLYM